MVGPARSRGPAGRGAAGFPDGQGEGALTIQRRCRPDGRPELRNSGMKPVYGARIRVKARVVPEGPPMRRRKRRISGEELESSGNR